MSGFGMSGRPMAGPSAQSIAQLQAVQQQLEFMSQMLDGVSAACAKKCMNTYHKEDNLTKAESTCIDRCALKMFETHKLANELQQQQMAQMNAGA